MSRESGTFSNHANGLKYVALTRAANAAGLPAHEVMNAVSNRRLLVYEVSGCKCVTLADLVTLKREGDSWRA